MQSEAISSFSILLKRLIELDCLFIDKEYWISNLVKLS